MGIKEEEGEEAHKVKADTKNHLLKKNHNEGKKKFKTSTTHKT